MNLTPLVLLAVLAGAAAPRPIDAWVAVGHGQLFWGADRRLSISGSAPSGATRSIELDRPIVAARHLRHGRLIALAANEQLGVLDTGASPAGWHALPTEPGGLTAASGLALAGDRLFVARPGHGVAVFRLSGGHHAPPSLRHAGLIPVSEPLRAIAAAPGYLYVALVSGHLLEIDLRDPTAPAKRLPLRLAAPLDALAANGRRLYALGSAGLQVIELSDPARVVTMAPRSDIRGRDLVVAGRALHVAGVDGVLTLRDAQRGAQTHSVAVGNNFFNPASIVIDAGDEVQWSNATGIGHNVRSCVAGQSGCFGGLANENFFSGLPSGLWFFSHTFVAAGSNPYVCQPHAASNMAGDVRVNGPPASPPPGVPDGAGGLPMTATRLDPAGGTLSISFDVSTCSGATQHQIVYGGGSQWPATPGGTYGLDGSRCDIGSTSPFVWDAVPDASAGPSGILWWLVLATDAATTEGSWGTDSSGSERDGPAAGGSSGECGVTSKDLTNTCGQ